jgi:hypothetical protein
MGKGGTGSASISPSYSGVGKLLLILLAPACMLRVPVLAFALPVSEPCFPCLTYSFTVKMEAVDSSKNLVMARHITWNLTPEDDFPHSLCCEKLQSHKLLYYLLKCVSSEMYNVIDLLCRWTK